MNDILYVTVLCEHYTNDQGRVCWDLYNREFIIMKTNKAFNDEADDRSMTLILI